MQKDEGTSYAVSPQSSLTEERENERRLLQERQQREDDARTQLQEEVRALEINPEATATLSGKIIRNNRAKAKHAQAEETRIRHIFDQFAFGAVAFQTLEKIAASLASLAGTFGMTVHQEKAGRFIDEHNIYDTESVTRKTYEKLSAEANDVFLREQKLASIEDPDIYMRELQEFAEYANSLDMRPHPVTGMFVHNYERVRAMEDEAFMNAIAPDAPVHKVFVFRARNLAAHDSRGLKVLVADQYDQNPDETIGTVDTGEVQARPIQPPGMHYIG